MPGFDGSGPNGEGRMGRGFGPCGGHQAGAGFRRGNNRRSWFSGGKFGGGRVRGRFFQSYSPQEEIAELEQEKTFLERRLENLKQLIQKNEE
ncbi:MAG: DUF5320 domain-containing protein [Anaerolineaceae bacterium]|nr:DUF5320 domain-containing protein [Anaerolineaceae bacterium]